jgi:hypothetical protein
MALYKRIVNAKYPTTRTLADRLRRRVSSPVIPTIADPHIVQGERYTKPFQSAAEAHQYVPISYRVIIKSVDFLEGERDHSLPPSSTSYMLYLWLPVISVV